MKRNVSKVLLKDSPFLKLKSLIEDLHKNPNEDQHRFGFASFYRSGEFGSFGLNEQQAENYFSVLDALVPDDGIPPLRSRSAVDKALVRCVLACLNPEEDSTASLEERIQSALAELKTSLALPLTQWEVWRFVDRITVPAEGFKFGNVLFCRESHIATKPLVGKIRRVIRISGKRRTAAAKLWRSRLEKLTLCQIFVEAGDKEAARQMAEFELAMTLDVLNFFASLFHLLDRLPALSIRHGGADGQDLSFYFQPGSKGFGFIDRRHRHRDNFDSRDTPEDRDIALAFARASQLLTEGDSELSKRLLSALKWAGKASVTENRENAFVFYAIALEALLLGQQHHEQLAYKLRLRAAHLLGTSSTMRQQMRDRVNKLYSLRSKIVHSGKTRLSEVDLDTLRVITQSCIIRLLSDEIFSQYSSDEELENWFEESVLLGREVAESRDSKGKTL